MRSSDVGKIVKHMTSSLERSVDRMLTEINNSIKSITPVRTGRARRGWRYSPRFRLGKGGAIHNSVPYINRLDEGASRQAPNGIVVPVLKRITRRRF